ncbi:hypothetical protein Cci01nite_58780 [Catellatospora citrea]|uniref:Uncharacterized protein n=1 Tax=Catellatospora citrea TaxID=53366 RepID=A0A8J3KHI9_9ACTN|nr:hypothetical protein Cci01nite_58780 [Catellatospora citrea]
MVRYIFRAASDDTNTSEWGFDSEGPDLRGSHCHMEILALIVAVTDMPEHALVRCSTHVVQVFRPQEPFVDLA